MGLKCFWIWGLGLKFVGGVRVWGYSVSGFGFRVTVFYVWGFGVHGYNDPGFHGLGLQCFEVWGLKLQHFWVWGLGFGVQG